MVSEIFPLKIVFLDILSRILYSITAYSDLKVNLFIFCIKDIPEFTCSISDIFLSLIL